MIRIHGAPPPSPCIWDHCVDFVKCFVRKLVMGFDPTISSTYYSAMVCGPYVVSC